MRRFVTGGCPPLALALLTLSWATLLAWETSPYGRYLHQGDWTALGLAAPSARPCRLGISCSPRCSMSAVGA